MNSLTLFDFSLLNRCVEERARLKKEAVWRQTDLDKHLVALEDAEIAHTVLQVAAQSVQQRVHHRISSVVTKCLAAVFEDPYTFQIVFEAKAGRTEAKIVLIRDAKEVDPMTGSGGGVVDVTAFALRVACLMLRRPQLRRLLVLDEPFRFVSARYRPRVRNLLESLVEEFGLQIIMVTHIEELKCGRVITLQSEKGIEDVGTFESDRGDDLD